MHVLSCLMLYTSASLARGDFSVTADRGSAVRDVHLFLVQHHAFPAIAPQHNRAASPLVRSPSTAISATIYMCLNSIPQVLSVSRT
jgi:hypothetical protein